MKSLTPLKYFKSLNIRKKKASAVIAAFNETMPDPRCELYYKTPYQLLVSVVLSAQATDKSVNNCMKPLYQKGLDPKQVLKMGVDGFREKIKTIGLANTKAKNVIALTKMYLEDFGEKMPKSHEALQSMPGVGRKTANVILGELFGYPTLAVDTHVLRVTRRLGWHQEEDASRCEIELLKIIEPGFLPKAHHQLILQGRYTCKARRPLCENCCIRDLCPNHQLFASSKNNGKRETAMEVN